MATVRSALARKLNRFLPLGPEELAALASSRPSSAVAAGTELIHEHEAGQRAFILQEGWACCYKLLPDGGRQIIDFRVPGDFMGLRSVLLRTADHSSTTVTDVVVAEVPVQRMLDTFQELPRLGAAILWAASRDEAMVVEHLVGIGRRSALARTAHFLVELGLRLELVGLGDAVGFACPLNQYLLADALGLTAIHVNRVLRQLRERELLTFRDGQVVFHDLPRLRQLAEHHGGSSTRPSGLFGFGLNGIFPAVLLHVSVAGKKTVHLIGCVPATECLPLSSWLALRCVGSRAIPRTARHLPWAQSDPTGARAQVNKRSRTARRRQRQDRRGRRWIWKGFEQEHPFWPPMPRQRKACR